MIEAGTRTSEDDDRRRRIQGLVTIAVWQVAAVGLPIALGAVLFGSSFFVNVEDQLVKPCDDPMECGDLVPGADQVLKFMVPFALASAVVALPVQLPLLKKMHPIAAGSLASFLAWGVCLAGVCLLGAVAGR
ncbi:hypothetical protein ACQP00_17360 [Dactylosporangium sp. CS-047395]|uniref:hypothetical protein n=1 Tax=Dactylosporangium sp. CS-047395 TaxID=3239936 RepID=UPI003D92E7BB